MVNQRRKTLTKHGRSIDSFFFFCALFSLLGTPKFLDFSGVFSYNQEGIRTGTNVLECSGNTTFGRERSSDDEDDKQNACGPPADERTPLGRRLPRQ